MPAILEIKELTIRDGTKIILSGLNLSMAKGEHLVLTGPSGSGKTSILLAILGYHSPDLGSIHFKGNDVGVKGIELLRSQISYIPQTPIAGALTFRESLLLPFTFRINRSKIPTTKDIEKILKKLNFDLSIMATPTAKLSGGEKQRLAMARELLLGKKIFLLDEVTSSLDPQNKEVMMNLLMLKKHTILSVSHDHDWIKRCSGKIEIRKGAVHSDSRRRPNGNNGKN